MFSKLILCHIWQALFSMYKRKQDKVTVIQYNKGKYRLQINHILKANELSCTLEIVQDYNSSITKVLYKDIIIVYSAHV